MKTNNKVKGLAAGLMLLGSTLLPNQGLTQEKDKLYLQETQISDQQKVELGYTIQDNLCSRYNVMFIDGLPASHYGSNLEKFAQTEIAKYNSKECTLEDKQRNLSLSLGNELYKINNVVPNNYFETMDSNRKHSSNVFQMMNELETERPKREPMKVEGLGNFGQ